MCIRDRGTIAKFDQRPLPVLLFHAPIKAAMTDIPFCEKVTCLLYTSDAADERSSVDLGGRRIIKKKNKSDIRGTLNSHIKT